jgi:predicted acetyltransferase
MEPSSSPVLHPALEHEAPLLANLFELYAHDLSAAFDLDVGADGRFGYAKLASYWQEPDRRFPFLVRVGDELAGFVLATRGSPATSDPADLDVAELFVLRRYRRGGVGAAVARALWDRLPGHWIVRVAERNSSALPFWTRVITDHTEGRFTRALATVGDKPWTVFAFDAPGARAGLRRP